jgi:hypothetical protein
MAMGIAELGAGERQAISLALKVDADVLLIDERAGRLQLNTSSAFRAAIIPFSRVFPMRCMSRRICVLATPDPKNPTAPWIVHKVSEEGYGIAAQHGIGVGDINGQMPGVRACFPVWGKLGDVHLVYALPAIYKSGAATPHTLWVIDLLPESPIRLRAGCQASRNSADFARNSLPVHV